MVEPMAPTGTDRQDGTAGWQGQVHRARALASALPDLLVEAHHEAASIVAGWHGRRRPGAGETFWQFRPFHDGEPAARIDWRRSARDEHLHVRETEWEAAHTIWVKPDISPSMDFASRLARATKRDRAVVLSLALAELLARAGERVAIPGLTRPLASRNVAERLAASLAHAPRTAGETSLEGLKRFDDVVILSDLLDPLEETSRFLRSVADTGANVHLVAILDPAEETFPYAGRTEFRDPETGARVLAGRAESWRETYQAELGAHFDELRRLAEGFGGALLVHHTDRPAGEPLFVLHARFAERREAGVRLSGAGAGR
ncbi:MAG: DUF58 domain-containing protein [Hyphomicrobiales bacterium]